MRRNHLDKTPTISRFTALSESDTNRYEKRGAAAKPDSGLANLSKKPRPDLASGCRGMHTTTICCDAGVSSVFVMRHAQSVPLYNIDVNPLTMHE